MREYLRDVGRFLRGERPVRPSTPANYFGMPTETRLARLAGRDRATMADYEAALGAAAPQRAWRGSAVRLYRRWLDEAAGVTAPARDLARAAS